MQSTGPAVRASNKRLQDLSPLWASSSSLCLVGGVGPGSGTVGLGHIVFLVSSMQKSQMLLKRYHWRGAERPGDWPWGGGTSTIMYD